MKTFLFLITGFWSSVSFAASFDGAVGVVKTYPFANKKQFISCTTFHIGNGWMVTAGHCFLGTQSCQNATVEFGTVKGLCVSVLSSRADDWDVSSPHEDYAVFKTDVVPKQKLDIDFNASLSTGTALATAMYPRPKSGSTYTIVSNELCKVTKSVASTPQGFILSPRSFEHNCGSAGGAQGAPLVSKLTGKVVGIHQGHGIVNAKQVLSTNGLTGLGFAKLTAGSRLKEDVAAISQGRAPGLRTFNSIVVGGFSQFAFPGALFPQISAKVVTLEALDAQKNPNVRFRIITGPETAATIVDGFDASYTISGTMVDTLLGEWSLKAPVSIYVGTPTNSNSVTLHIRDIR